MLEDSLITRNCPAFMRLEVALMEVDGASILGKLGKFKVTPLRARKGRGIFESRLVMESFERNVPDYFLTLIDPSLDLTSRDACFEYFRVLRGEMN
ncbi:hypothetical protein WN48_04774 [Eufriesea mexicana]|uniref:Uncharacterized protein n=1 Tax=Eufriesea mexicana TaxID=516756 RepID=A0A310S9Y9_9HYME|nr:hypothetical protein WN48_04774 [Eufriesea mexicana]